MHSHAEIINPLIIAVSCFVRHICSYAYIYVPFGFPPLEAKIVGLRKALAGHMKTILLIIYIKCRHAVENQ